MARWFEWMTNLQSWRGQQSNILFIGEGQNTTCNMWSWNILLEDDVWQAKKIDENNGLKMSEINGSAFKLKPIGITDIRMMYSMAAPTITSGARQLCRYRMLASDVRSSRSFHKPVRLILLRRARIHLKRRYCVIPVSISAVRRTRDYLCCIVKGTRNKLCWTDGSRCCKHLQAVLVETRRAIPSQMCPISD